MHVDWKHFDIIKICLRMRNGNVTAVLPVAAPLIHRRKTFLFSEKSLTLQIVLIT
jgi:hypothetical protein